MNQISPRSRRTPALAATFIPPPPIPDSFLGEATPRPERYIHPMGAVHTVLKQRQRPTMCLFCHLRPNARLRTPDKTPAHA